MAAFLVTGNPGSGKSSLALELSRRGLFAIDPDDDSDLSYWEDDNGHRVSNAARPPAPEREWLLSHRWVWSRPRMQELLDQHDGLVFVCGVARNLDQVVDLFDRIVLLRIEAETQEARLVAHDAVNPASRSEAGRQEIRDGRPVFEAEMLELGAVAVAGNAPTAVVADEILTLIGDVEA